MKPVPSRLEGGPYDGHTGHLPYLEPVIAVRGCPGYPECTDRHSDPHALHVRRADFTPTGEHHIYRLVHHDRHGALYRYDSLAWARPEQQARRQEA